MAVKQVACERLLAYRVDAKVAGKRISDVLNRIHVAQPKQRDATARPPVIPPGVAEARARRAAGERKKLQRDYQEEAGGAGVYSMDMRQLYDLKDPQWKDDIMPEVGRKGGREEGKGWHHVALPFCVRLVCAPPCTPS